MLCLLAITALNGLSLLYALILFIPSRFC
jgi:hypothetical protein